MDMELLKLIGLLKEIEKKSREIYTIFKRQSDNDIHRQFWADISKDETAHIAFWEKLRKAGEKKPLKNPFYEIEKTISQTTTLLERVKHIKKTAVKLKTTENHIKHAIVLEALLLNPAFTILFRSVKTQIKQKTPETTYHDHIQKLIDFAQENLSRQDFILYSLALESAYQQSTDIANLISRIDGLEALIPICAWCKNVRKKDGEWVRIEAYIMNHSQSEFTHGICPDCKHKL
ncbi:MAG: hypothetical protein KJ737_13205 [Proteobacteria bacterium]|nr:hypothetical protein [Pseudomonadota bacterium]